MTNEYYAEVNIDEEIYCNSVINTKDFEIFTKNVNGRNKITGFKFKFKYDAKVDRKTNYLFIQDKIFHYLDLISSITHYPNNKNNYRLAILNSNNSEITSWKVDTLIPSKPPDIDIDLSQHKNTLTDLSHERVENLRYYYAGVIFYNSHLYDFCIREFFKIIETYDPNTVNGYNDYKTIRDLFSHNINKRRGASKIFLDPNKSNLKNKFQHTTFKDKNNNDIVIINKYLPNNQHSLILMANELSEIVKPTVLN
jgi:hypothetical protein